MSWLGKFQYGDFLPLMVSTRDGKTTPSFPDAAPFAEFWTGGSKVLTVTLACSDRHGVNGIFIIRYRLTSTLATGKYSILFRSRVSGYIRTEEHWFHIVAGGDSDGAVIAMNEFQRPEANYIISQLDGGKIVQGRNPSLKRAEGNA